MLGNYVFHHNVSHSCSGSAHKCSCLNLVRNNRIACTMKLFHSTDTDNIRTCAFNISTHTVQEVRHIYYMGLSCRIFNGGISLSHGCCHHNVNGSSYRNHIQENMLSKQLICFCNNCAMDNIHRCSQGSESF